MCEEKLKLYEVAPLLSPSIYETIFYNQYQGRSDKNSIILDDKIFNKFYIEENIYRNFLFSNSNRLKNAFNYIGLSQMYGSLITHTEIKDNSLYVTLVDASIDILAKSLMSYKDIKVDLEPFVVTIIFENILKYSNNILDENELLIRTTDTIENSIYTQDQVIYIDDKNIDIAISLQSKDNIINYFLISVENINIIDNARDLWMKIFCEDNFAMLYDYFINIRKSSRLNLEDNIYISIIKDYEKFMNDLDFL